MHRFQSHRAVLSSGSETSNNKDSESTKLNDDDANTGEQQQKEEKSSTYMRTNGTLSHFFKVLKKEGNCQIFMIEL